MKKFAAISVLAIALSACGGGATNADADGDGEVTVEEAEAFTSEELKPEPGKYKAEMALVSAEGLPEEMQAMIGEGMKFSDDICVTEEMAEKGFGQQPNQSEDDGCSIKKYELDGGQLDMAIECVNDKDGMNASMTMTGEVSSTSQDLTITTKGAFPGNEDASMVLTMKQERIGDCDA